MYSPQLEELIDAILADGVITPQERMVLHRRAVEEGIDPNEIDVVVEGRLVKMRQQKPSHYANPQYPSAQGPYPPVPPAPPVYPSQSVVPSRPAVPVQPVSSRPVPVRPVSTSPLPVQPSTSKYGKVYKCPNCGLPVTPGTFSCTGCGYVFQGVQANSSIETLSNRLLSVDMFADEDGEVSVGIIKNFPIPTTRNDLLEFILYTHSKADKGISVSDTYREQSITKAYMTKYDECIDKARFYFGNDPQFRPLFEQHDRLKSNKWKNFSSGTKMAIFWAALVLFCIILSFIMQALDS